MRRLAALFAIALAGFGLAPAQAADIRQIDCPLTELTDRERGAFGEMVAAQGQPSDPRGEPFRRALARCAERFGWSQEAAMQSAVFGISSAGHDVVRRELAALGIDLAELERALLADAALMAAIRSGSYSQADGEAFATRHMAMLERLVAGQRSEGDVAERIGHFVGFRAMMEIARLQFPQS